MKSIKITVKPFDIIEVLVCTIKKNVNQHFSANIEGYTSMSDEDIMRMSSNSEFIISVQDEEGIQHTIFRGGINQISITSEGQLKIIKISAQSHTYHLEAKKAIRVFQDENQTYKNIVKFIGAQNKSVGLIFSDVSNKQVQGLLVQFQETDWDFLKRIASLLNTVIVADCETDHTCLYFGVIEKKGTHYLNDVSYSVNYYENNLIEYLVKSREVLKLCSKVIVNESVLLVYSIESKLEGGELVHQYKLRTREGFRVSDYKNLNIIGASLSGRVNNIINTQIQVDFDCDNDVKGHLAKWFQYATVYSSSDGTGWYCMPEKQDEVRIYFPDEVEDHAYAVSAVHYGRISDMRINPDEKSIRTVYDKEIRFTPDKIMITNHKGLSIVLDDQEGILIKSNKSVNLSAADIIHLSSKTGISMKADNGITFTQNDNSLTLKDGIRQNGMSIQYK